jgi:transposase InsO family protein
MSKHGRLFLQDMRPSSSFFATSMGVLDKLWTVWHRRRGHLNNSSLLSLFKLGCLEHSADDRLFSAFVKSKCEACCLSKSHVLPFPVHFSRTIEAFNVIHTDVWGIAPHLSRMGYKYYVTFIDDHCRYTWIYFLRFKSEVFSTFQKFYNMVCTEFQKSIKILRFDLGGEYMSSEFSSFLSNKGIIHQKSCPHIAQQNGIVERKNRHILEMVQSLLIEALVPPKF